MQLTQDEQDLLDGRHGELLAKVFAEQVAVGDFFGAKRFVPVANAHFMGDPEVFGEAGTDYLTKLVDAGLKTRVPTSRNASCSDFEHADFLRQSKELVKDEAHVRVLLAKLGVITANTCIGYQTLYQPVQGEHVAWGDTGTVAYANSVLGARTNYESGSASLAAGLTGRTPEYGFHLDENRLANIRVRVSADLSDYADWGALGGLIGSRYRGYENVAVFELEHGGASSDNLKHLGAALASYGSMAMFHVVGVTPEAPTVEAARGDRELLDDIHVDAAELAAYRDQDSFDGDVDLVVFTAPQLSLLELRTLAEHFEGRKVADTVQLIITTNGMTYAESEHQGFLSTLQEAGALVLNGTCWYIMDPAAQAKQFGWKNLVSNSAKLVNIVRAHGYTPVLRTTADCVAAAITGKLVTA